MPPKVSLCLIVKNEEANLPACLDSATGLVDELIVVDTGSTDTTKDVARQRGARVFDFPWVDSFAAARNESIRHATGEWIFWMDADDRIDEENRGKLRALFSNLPAEIVGYSLQVRCLPNPETGTAMVTDHIRLFPNHREIRWQYRVHEQIAPAIERLGGSLKTSGIIIQHAGYQDTALRTRKNERNLRLLRLEETENPNDPITLYHLGWTSLDLGRPREAIGYLYRSLRSAPPQLASVRKNYALLVNCHSCLGQTQEAFAVCLEGRSRFPEDGELLYMEGVLRMQQGELAGAETCFLYLLGAKAEQQQMALYDLGLFGYLARNQLASLCFEQNRLTEAETHWRAVIAERPDFTNAWMGLVEIWRAQGNWQALAEAEQAARSLEQVGSKAVDALLLRGRVHMARQEFAAARQTVEEAVARAPQSVLPYVHLSHVLLLEGRDWPAAELALRNVLRLDPGNVDARRNLDILLRKFGQAPDQQRY